MITVSTEADSIITAVNYHFYKPCNMKCGFCFATFNDIANRELPNSNLLLQKSYLIIDELAKSGFKKINFAGGEPLLYKQLPNIIKHAKECGLATSIITNGSLLNRTFLDKTAKHTDWIGVSIDSVNRSTNFKIGRFIQNGKPFHLEDYVEIIKLINNYGIKSKVNTVVNAYNFNETLDELFDIVTPLRWKVFQTLKVAGQNDALIDNFLIDSSQYQLFIDNQKYKDLLIAEDNELMTGSYIMIDPKGRFFDDTKGKHTYSRGILDVGVSEALRDINFSLAKFKARKGEYDWNK